MFGPIKFEVSPERDVYSRRTVPTMDISLIAQSIRTLDQMILLFSNEVIGPLEKDWSKEKGVHAHNEWITLKCQGTECELISHTSALSVQFDATTAALVVVMVSVLIQQAKDVR